jgi:hypothetical protein
MRCSSVLVCVTVAEAEADDTRQTTKKSLIMVRWTNSYRHFVFRQQGFCFSLMPIKPDHGHWQNQPKGLARKYRRRAGPD